MAFPFLAAVAGYNGLSGLLSASAEARRAREAREAAFRDLEAAGNAGVSDAVGGNQTDIFALTGLLGDALRTHGANLGAADAASGVYNSGATAGANAQYAGQGAQLLAQTAAQGQAQVRSLKTGLAERLARLKLGYADSDLQDAQGNMAASRGGLMSLLGSLQQFNQAQSGAMNANSVGVAMNGNHNSVLPGLPPLRTQQFTLPDIGALGAGLGNNPAPSASVGGVDISLLRGRRDPFKGIGYKSPRSLLRS